MAHCYHRILHSENQIEESVYYILVNLSCSIIKIQDTKFCRCKIYKLMEILNILRMYFKHTLIASMI